MNNGDTLLERLFFGSVNATILGHLVICRPLDYSIKELSKIHNLSEQTIRTSLDILLEFEMIEKLVTKYGDKYRVSDSEPSKYFQLFVNKLLLWNLDRLSNQNTEGQSGSVNKK